MLEPRNAFKPFGLLVAIAAAIGLLAAAGCGKIANLPPDSSAPDSSVPADASAGDGPTEPGPCVLDQAAIDRCTL